MAQAPASPQFTSRCSLHTLSCPQFFICPAERSGQDREARLAAESKHPYNLPHFLQGTNASTQPQRCFPTIVIAGQTTIVTNPTQETASPLHPHSRIIAGTALALASIFVGCTREQAGPAPSAQAQTARASAPAKPANLLSCPAGSPGTPPLQASGSHQVVLSWNASVPTPNAANDPVQGYCVYRSTKKKASLPDKIRVSANPIAGTGCVDDTPQDGQTYYYSLLAISSKSRVSVFSEGIRAKIPPTKLSTPLPSTSLPLCRGDAPLPQN